MLFWKENKDLEKCKVCQKSRWKNVSCEYEGENSSKDQKYPAKVVRYFSLIPRLQRLFMSTKTAPFMRWHAEERIDDGILRHLADAMVWKDLDQRYPEFSLDCRNVRLGLSADGFNPFKTRSIVHSTWLIVLKTLNLPPWMCRKQPYLILPTLIDGPKGSGDKIDVYLQPLVDELKILWEDGIRTYDAASDSMFNMHAALLWTISD